MVVVLDDPETPTDPVLDALTEPGGGFEFRSAAVVRRDADGAVTIGEHAGDLDTEGTLVERHPRLAGLLTALLAPVDTLLLGNSLVALTGALAEPSPDERVLLQLARAIPAGSTAVIADVVETDSEDLDHRLAGHAVTVTRHPLDDVEADLADPHPAPTADPAGVTPATCSLPGAWVTARSGHHYPSVDDDRLPGHVVRVRPSEVGDERGDVVRGLQAAERDGGAELGLRLALAGAQIRAHLLVDELPHVGVDDARAALMIFPPLPCAIIFSAAACRQ